MTTLRNQTGSLGAGDGLQQDISTRANLSVAIGEGANKINSGQGNVVQGYGAGISLTKSSYNTIAGYRAAESATASDYNVLLGPFTGRVLIGTENVYAGAYSGEKATRTSRNVGIGAFTFNESENSLGSVGVGYRACARLLTGNYNTAVGTQAAENARDANFSTMVGYQSGRASFITNGNTYVGAFSGYSNATGSYNVMIGYRSGENLASGDYSIAIGANSLANGIGGQSNVAIGFGAANNGGGAQSVILGAGTGPNAAGVGNVIIGAGTAKTLIGGGSNVVIGVGANTYTPNTNESITIGNNDVVGGTRTISIGENIENKQVNSTLIGYTLTSDAANTVMVGNAISIDSVLIVKDPLNESIKAAVASDALEKFGISNINYTNTLSIPYSNLPVPYTIATAAVITSNIVNSSSQPLKGALSPATYNLLEPSITPYYAINHGTSIALTSTPTDPLNVTITIDGRPTSQTSNLVYSSYAALYGPPPKPMFSFTPARTINVIAFNKTTDIAPVHFVKRSHIPYLASSNTHLALNANIFTPTTSNVATPLLTSSGIPLPVTSAIAYVLDTPPIYGTTTMSMNTFTYTPYPEFAFASNDSFKVLPVLNVRDTDSNIYGIPASNIAIISVSKPSFSFTTSNIVFVQPNHIITTTDIAANPPISSTPLRITEIDPATVIIYTSGTTSNVFTSNDIYQMNAEQIDNWPLSAIGACNDNVRLTAYTNLSTTSNTFATNIFNIKNDVISLNDIYSDPSFNFAPTYTEAGVMVDSYTSNPFTQSFSNIWYRWTSNTHVWIEQNQIPSTPETVSLLDNNTLFQSGFFPEIWSGGSNLITFIQTIPTTYSPVAAASALTLLPSFSSIPNFSSVADEYTILYHKYYEVPRLFIEYGDIQTGRVTIRLPPATTLTDARLQFAGYNPILLIQDVTETLYPSITQTLSVSIPSTSNVQFPLVQIPLPLHTNGNYIQTTLPLSGLLWTSNASANTITNVTFPSNNASNAYYQVTDPYALHDYTRIVYTEPPLSTHYDVSFTRPYGHFNSSIKTPAKPQVIELISTSNIIYSTTTKQFWASNVSILTTTTSNMTTTPPTIISSLPTTTIQHINIYDPTIGYAIATSNLITTNYPVPIDSTTSNIYYSETNYIFPFPSTEPYTPTINTNSFTQPQYPELANIDTTITLTTYTSNFAAYTSNFTAYTSNHVINTHYSHTESIYLWTDDKGIVANPPPISTPILTTTLASQETLFNETSNIIQQSNISFIEPTFQLSRTFMYSWTDSNVIYNLKPNDGDSLLIVNSNIGPVTVWTQSNILNESLFIVLPPNIPTATSSNLSLKYSLPVFSNVTLSIQATGYNGSEPMFITGDPIPLSLGNNIRTPFANILPESMASEHIAINIAHLQKGALVGPGSNIITSFTNHDSVDYYRTGPYSIDSVTYSTSNVITSVTSGFIQRSLHITCDPLDIGLAYNTGLDDINHTVQSRALFVARGLTLPADITITPSTDPLWTFEPYPFSLQNVLDGTVEIFKGANAPNTTVAFTIGSTTTTLPLISYLYNAFPSAATALGSDLTIARIGSSNTLNIGHGALWTNYTTGSIAATTPMVLITQPPTKGILWSLNNLNTRFPLTDIYASDIRYVVTTPTATPATISNDSFKMRLITVTGGMSPEYTVALKNYFAPFIPTAVDPTQYWSDHRIIPSPYINTGLTGDGYSWQPNAPYIMPASNILYTHHIPLILTPSIPVGAAQFVVPGSTDILNVTSYAYSSQPIPTTTHFNLATDQADSLYFDQVLTTITSNIATRNVYFYVTTQPTTGVVYNTLTGAPRPVFTADEVRTRTVAYQHLGGSNTSDSLTLNIASHPYDFNSTNIVVDIAIRPMPYITTNSHQYAWFDSASNANTVINHFSSSKLVLTPSTTSNYFNIIASANGAAVSFANSNIVNVFAATDPVGFRVAINPTASNIYAPTTLLLAPNSTPPVSPLVAHVNPLAYIPTYSNLFLIPWTCEINHYVNSNVITVPQTPNQVISYEFDGAAPNYSQLDQRVISIGFNVQPDQTLIADKVAGGNSENLEFLRTYDFTLDVITTTGTNLMNVNFKKGLVTLRTPSVPIPLTFASTFPFDSTTSVFTNVLLMNQDNNNDATASLYIGYDATQSRVDNAIYNILRGKNVPSVDFSNIGKITFTIDTTNPYNFIGGSNFVRPSAKSIGSDALNFAFELLNYKTTLLFRDITISASTYKIILGEVESLPDNLLTHNVVIGESIQVRGTNNLCIGNNFTTSGKNSIILGNDIGISPDGAVSGQVNDIYECIIMGNGSFQNSVVRGIISVGNNHMQDLSLSAVANVNYFLSQKPILIGNDITRSALDYNINIGNVFLKTTVGAPRVFIGNTGEYVGIGYTSNTALPATLSVAGSMAATYYNGFVAGTPCTITNSVTTANIWYTVVSSGLALNNVAIASINASPAVFGVIAAITTTSSIIVYTSGSAFVWVAVDTVLVGDLLETSASGMAKKQTGTTITSSTLGKATLNGSLATALKTMVIASITYCLISCTLLCG